MREIILGLLLLGPQYGLQLRSEARQRTFGRVDLNPGQIYQTLERLKRDGLVELDGQTEDGLALYCLTSKGRGVALLWSTSPQANVSKYPWDTMVTQILIANSLPCVSMVSLFDEYYKFWSEYSTTISSTNFCDERNGNDLAVKLLSSAAIKWLDSMRLAERVTQDLSPTRPTRGRPKS